MTTDTAITPAFGACEELFAAHPDSITDEGDSGRLMPVTVAGGRLRLVQHDTAMGRFYRLYQLDDDLAILTIAPDYDIPAGIAAHLAAAVPA